LAQIFPIVVLIKKHIFAPYMCDKKFVVKRSKRRLNQIDPDQSQEWLNGTGKKGGGIIGITKTTTALSRWALSYNLRSHMSCESREMYHLNMDEEPMHNESTKGRQKQDRQDEDNLMAVLLSFNIFANEESPVLQNIATKDLATQKIGDDLLNAKHKGQKQLNTFVEDRLLPCEERKVKFRDPLHNNKPLTFSSLFDAENKCSKASKDKVLKADRLILQWLIIADEAGQRINLDEILSHELLLVTIALAEINGDIRTGSKAILSQVLTGETPYPPMLAPAELGDNATIIIDGQALVIAIGKPHGLSTFGDLADVFKNTVLQIGHLFDRIDVAFDRYYKVSIKSGTRKRRAKGIRPIRRVIDSREVPLPADWSNFLALGENKADLARFLSEQMVGCDQHDKTIVVAGGFTDEG